MTKLSDAAALEADGKDAKAASAYERIATDYPFTKTAATAQYRAGVAYERVGKREKAFNAYQTLIEKQPQSAEYVTALERQYNIVTDLRTNRGGWAGLFKVTDENLIELYQKIIANGTRSPWAPKAQFAIGELYASLGDSEKSTASFQKIVDTYPDSQEAIDAAYKVGDIAFATAKKTRDATNLNKAREAYEGATTLFGQAPQAAGAAANLRDISDTDAEKSFKIARFYDKKGNAKSAVIYYTEVLKAPTSPHFAEAKQRLGELSADDPKLIDSMPGVNIAQADLAIPARVDTKSRADYFGPPAPLIARNTPRARPRGLEDAIPFSPLEEPTLPSRPEGAPEGGTMKDDLLLPPPPGKVDTRPAIPTPTTPDPSFTDPSGTPPPPAIPAPATPPPAESPAPAPETPATPPPAQ